MPFTDCTRVESDSSCKLPLALQLDHKVHARPEPRRSRCVGQAVLESRDFGVGLRAAPQLHITEQYCCHRFEKHCRVATPFAFFMSRRWLLKNP